MPERAGVLEVVGGSWDRVEKGYVGRTMVEPTAVLHVTIVAATAASPGAAAAVAVKSETKSIRPTASTDALAWSYTD